MPKCNLRKKTCQDLISMGDIVACVDHRQEAATCTTWLELGLYRTDAGEFILSTDLYVFLNTDLYVFQSADKPLEYFACVSFATAWDVYDYLLSEGDGLEDLVNPLLHQAATNDAAFASVLEHASKARTVQQPSFDPAKAAFAA